MRNFLSASREGSSDGTRPLPTTLIPLAVLVVGLCATALVSYQLGSVAKQRDRAAFDRHVQREHNAILSRTETYTALLHGTAGLLVSDRDEVTAATFRAYVDELQLRDRYPGLLGIGFSQRVSPDDEPALVADMQAQGFADFRIWPETSQAERTTIRYLEPLDVRNRAAVGFDMYTEAVRREAMQRARDEGTSATSGKVTLVQEIDEEKQPGFLIYLPVYDRPATATREERRRALRGYAYSPIRAWDFFRSIEQDTNQPSVTMAVYDGSGVDPDRRLFHSDESQAANGDARFRSVRTIEIAGRPWTIVIDSTPEFFSSLQRNLIPAVAFIGAILTLILTTLLWRDGRLRAEASRARMYAEATLRTSPVPLLVLEKNLRVVTANEAFYARFQVNAAETEGELIYALGSGQWNIPGLRDLLDDILRTHSSFDNYEVEHDFEHIGPRVMLLNARRMEVEHGGPQRIILVIEDITDRKRAEEALRDQSRLLESIANNATTSLFIMDDQQQCRYMNPAAESLTGYTLEETKGRPLHDVVHHTRRDGSPYPLSECPIDQAFPKNDQEQGEEVFVHKTGRFYDVAFTASPLRDEEGKPVGTVIEVQDITERKRAEEQLQRERDLLSVTLSSIGDAVITTDTAGLITNLNFVAESLTGWTSAEAAGQPLENVFRIVNEQTRQTVESPAARALRDGVIVGLANHTILIAKDGTELPIDDSAAPIRGANDRIIGCVLVFRDVSDRRQAEQRLQQSELRYRLVGDAANDAIWDWNLISDEVTWNEGVRTRFGYTTEQVGPDASWWVEHIHPEDREHVVDSIHAAIDGIAEQWQHQYRFRRSDGSYIHVLDRGRILRTDSGKPIRMVGSMFDLTERIEAEEKLRVQEAQYRSIFQSTSDAILIFDFDGRLIEVNPAGCRMHGYSYEEFLGIHGTQFVHPQDHHKFDDFVRQVRAGETFHVEAQHVRKDGQPISIQVTGTSFVFGGRSALLAVVRDITEEKRATAALRESEERLRFIMDSMPQKIFTATPRGDVQYMNPIWSEYTGLPIEDILNWGWTQFIHPDDVDENVRVWRHSVETGEPYQFEHRFRRADGEYRWHITRALPMRDDAGQTLMWIGSNTDIQDAKKLQDELRGIAAELSEANRRKSEFLAILGHELRNPLAPIRTGLELMSMIADDPVRMEVTRSMMERQTQQLARLIDDLLDVSRITQGKLQLRTVRLELAEVMQSAVDAARPCIDEASHELRVTLPSQPLYLDADPNRLAQVFSNLLNNAAKYTPQGGRIWLSAERQQREVVVTVRDTGIGIPEGKKASIFEMFSQIDRPHERGYKGLGIGLTLVKRLVELHGGKVEVRSDGEGQGSEFIVRLPLVLAESAPDSQEPGSGESAEPTSRLRVLVVDDNKAAADTLAMVIEMLGNEVRTAYDGAQGVEAAEAFKPDVVLMDLGMPRMNGYEAANSIRMQHWGKHMVLVALTGWGQEEDRQRTQKAGFDHHLVKPAEPAELRSLFADLAGRTS